MKTTRKWRASITVLALLVLLPATALAAGEIVQQTSLTEGSTYWFDLSSVEIPGEVNTNLSGGLSWVPFTYVGEVDAYVLNSSSSGVTDASDTASSATDSSGTYGYAYSHNLFIADYNVTNSVSWDELHGADLIFGKDYSSDGVTYTLRALTTGNTDSNSTISPANNECDKILEKDSGSYIKNLSGQWFWGQDTNKSNTTNRTVYGNDITYGNLHGYYTSTSKASNVGYRPVLELPADSASDLTTVTINLNGGSIGTTTGSMTLIVKSGENYTAPSGDSLTAPEGTMLGGWKGSNGTNYLPDASVPDTATSLTALWSEIPTVTKHPQSATYYVGDEAAALTVEATVPEGCTVFYQWYIVDENNLADEISADGVTIIDGATSSSYTPPTDTAGTYYYRCWVMNYDPNVLIGPGGFSDPATITVQEESTSATYSVTVYGGTGSGEYEAGKTVTITANPPIGKQFSYWTVTAGGATLADAASATTIFTMPAQAVSVTANFRNQSSSTSDDSSEPSYSITVPSKIEGGSITVRPTRAERGDTVTITVTPDDGWELDTLTVTDRSGKEIDLTDRGEGKYTFTMPGRAVAVEAVFAELTLEPEPEPIVLPFTDVPAGAWYEQAVQYVYANGLMTGTSAATFSPDTVTSRAMIAAILYRQVGSPMVDPSVTFTDVGEGQWYTQAVRWAGSAWVVTGYGDGMFGPDEPITREQLAVILYRFAAFRGYDVSAGGMAVREFGDYADISDWALEAMAWAVHIGLLGGKDGNVLDPAGTATRAEVAAVLQRFLEN